MSYRELTCQTLEFGGFGRKTKPRYSILGVPYDFTSTYRPGSRFGPNAIREASLNLEAYCIRSAFDVENVPVEDLGDLSVLNDANATTELLRKIIKEIVEERKFPVILGGEHTITYGSARAFEETAILSLDAHLDLRNEYLGNKLSHAAFMRRLCEVFGPQKIFEIGSRAMSVEELTFAKENKVQYLTTREVEHMGVKNAVDRLKLWVSQFKNLYITVDMDVMDPAYAPGVGNPVPEGLSPTLLLDLLQPICGPKVVGLDVVEVSPNYDSGITALQASNLIYNVIAFLETSKA
jgi:agmatinase